MPEYWRAARNFSEQGKFRGTRVLNKHFVKNKREKCATGKHFGVSSPRYSYNEILNGKFNPEMDMIRALFIFITLYIPENS